MKTTWDNENANSDEEPGRAATAAAPQSDLRRPLISVVLPVYNEAYALPILTARLAQTLERCRVRYEILFVNDGSTDSSPRVLDNLASMHEEVRVLHLSRNFGHQAAVQAGVAHARGDAVVLMDSDMQDKPEAIIEFLRQWQAGYDVVYAVRTQRKEAAWKRLLFNGFHRLLAGVADVPIPADAGIFGLIDRRVAAEITALGECDRYFPGLRSWVGFRQIGVPVERHARYDAHPRVSLMGLVRLATTALFGFSAFPLRLLQMIGGAAGLVFILLGGYALGCKLVAHTALPGWTWPVLSGSFFGALNAWGICMLGEYLVRIYDQVRRRPLYLVARRVNCSAAPTRCEPTAAHAERHEADTDGAGDEPYLALIDEVRAMTAAARGAAASHTPPQTPRPSSQHHDTSPENGETSTVDATMGAPQFGPVK